MRARIMQTVNSSPIRRTHFVRDLARRASLAAMYLLALVYLIDLAVFRYRVTTNHQPFGSVTIEHYYSVAHKDGRAEYIFDPPVQAPCVHSLFPHAGDPPCWYLSRHTEPRTNM